eukprot:6211294-Pleurochrysis_carterae.AAC.1
MHKLAQASEPEALAERHTLYGTGRTSRTQPSSSRSQQAGGQLAAGSLKVVSLRDIQYKQHTVHIAARKARRTMDNALMVEQCIAVLGRAASFEERHIAKRERSRMLRVGALASQRSVRMVRMHPLRARPSICSDEAKWHAVLVPIAAAVIGREHLETDEDILRSTHLGKYAHQRFDVADKI